MMIGWPSSGLRASNTARGTMSVALPAPNGMKARIGFSGQVWADAADTRVKLSAMAAIRHPSVMTDSPLGPAARFAALEHYRLSPLGSKWRTRSAAMQPGIGAIDMGLRAFGQLGAHLSLRPSTSLSREAIVTCEPLERELQHHLAGPRRPA